MGTKGENEDVWFVLETGKTKGTMLRRRECLVGHETARGQKKAGLDPLLGEKYFIPSLPWPPSLTINQAEIGVAYLYFKRA